ncbi:MAG: tripartite tricarboxylate transporter substrate binding protein [Betaproteobacteria bacterium]|nr:tripartite tricarboxylate transporter substrate binding protein [Betaproteobacteria bacterium]MBV9361361.1 tripartite tricarboxylate transporter substrate binding protein [Betaproteobacteria bacterium]
MRKGIFVLLLLAATSAFAQTYPTKPIRILIAQAPGSATDVISRVVGNRLSEALGQPVVIEAKPGAGGVLGTEAAAHSAPDGYALFMANNSTHGSNPALYPKLPYDAVNDFAPISMVASVPYVLIVNPTMPVGTVDQLIKLAKAQPGRINYASAGNGSTHQFCAELLKNMAGIDLVHVPYKGSPPGVTAVVAGEVGVMFANLTDIGGQLKGGKVKPLAVTSASRNPHLPETPTLAEAGLPGFEILSWFALVAPAGTPASIIKQLNTEAVKVLGRDDVKSTLGAQGLTVYSSTPEQVSAHIKSEIAKFTRIAQAAGIKAE